MNNSDEAFFRILKPTNIASGKILTGPQKRIKFIEAIQFFSGLNSGGPADLVESRVITMVIKTIVGAICIWGYLEKLS